MYKTICLTVLISATISLAQDWDQFTLTVAMAEYQPIHNQTLTTEEILTYNTDKYLEAIEKLTVNDTKLDLIVFPEDTLHHGCKVEDILEFSSLVNRGDSPDQLPEIYPNFMQRISSAARQHQTYIIVNIVEKEPCGDLTYSPNCQTHGYFFYNCDVVLNNTGQILERYRKFNLFGEYPMDKPLLAEEQIFSLDDKIVMGMFTCFDILFKAPTQNLVENGISYFVFPSMWFSELPFLTGLQAQQMWSQAHNVTLFAAGANNLQVGSGGSGAYRGAEGPMIYDISTNDDITTYTYKFVYLSGIDDYNPQPPMEPIDVDQVGRSLDNYELITDPSIPDFEYSVLDFTSTNLVASVCHKDFCCRFGIRTTIEEIEEGKDVYTYFLVAFSGVRSFSGLYNGGVELCGVIACLNASIESCGRRFDNYDNIQWPWSLAISISADFEIDTNRTQYPNSLLSSLRPINVTETEWSSTVHNNTIERSFSTTKPQDRLLTFAIYGRNFAWDSPPDEGNSHSMILSSFNIMCLIMIASGMYQILF